MRDRRVEPGGAAREAVWWRAWRTGCRVVVVGREVLLVDVVAVAAGGEMIWLLYGRRGPGADGDV